MAPECTHRHRCHCTEFCGRSLTTHHRHKHRAKVIQFGGQIYTPSSSEAGNEDQDNGHEGEERLDVGEAICDTSKCKDEGASSHGGAQDGGEKYVAWYCILTVL